jgi:hypothetical protein
MTSSLTTNHSKLPGSWEKSVTSFGGPAEAVLKRAVIRVNPVNDKTIPGPLGITLSFIHGSRE